MSVRRSAFLHRPRLASILLLLVVLSAVPTVGAVTDASGAVQPGESGAGAFGSGTASVDERGNFAVATALPVDGFSWSGAEPWFRSAFLVGVMVLLGAPLTLLFAVYPVVKRRNLGTLAADRATLWLFVGAFVAVLAGAAGLAFGGDPAPESLSVAAVVSYLATGPGTSLVVRTGVVVALCLVTVVAVRTSDRLSRRAWLFSVTCGGLVLALSISRTNHSAAGVSKAVGVFAGFGHQLGAGAWVGGVAVLAVVAPVYLRRAEDPSAAAGELIRRFSVVAMAGVTVAVATGLAIASWHVPTAESLGQTDYGGLVVVKVLLVLLAVGMGGVNRLVLGRNLVSSRDSSGGRNAVWAGPAAVLGAVSNQVPSGGGTVRSFVGSIRVELAVLVLVVVLSGLLTSIPTAADVAASGIDTVERGFGSRIAAVLGVQGGFGPLLRYGAMGVAVAGAIVVAFELGYLRGRRTS